MVEEGSREIQSGGLRPLLVEDLDHCIQVRTYKALILCEEDGDASIDFANGEGDEHGGFGGSLIAVYCSVVACVDREILATNRTSVKFKRRNPPAWQ